MISALLQVAAAPAAPPSKGSVFAKPSLYVELKVTSAVFTVRIEPTAEASLAAMRERSRLGIAIAAMIKMIATTINNSIREKPCCRFFILFSWWSTEGRVQRQCHEAGANGKPLCYLF